MRRVGDHGKHISIRFDTETHDKLFYIAEYEGRSGSGQIARRQLGDKLGYLHRYRTMVPSDWL